MTCQSHKQDDGERNPIPPFFFTSPHDMSSPAWIVYTKSDWLLSLEEDFYICTYFVAPPPHISHFVVSDVFLFNSKVSIIPELSHAVNLHCVKLNDPAFQNSTLTYLAREKTRNSAHVTSDVMPHTWEAVSGLP